MDTLNKKTKGHKIFWGAMILLFAVMMLELGWKYYDRWHAQKRVAELASELQRLEQERYDRMAADTVGGKTPQETLEMFIAAVEAGDYELASKYFVTERQAEELTSLQNSPREKIANVMALLKQTDYSDGGYSTNNLFFTVHTPLLVNLVFYPSGNWKIEKI